MIVDKLLFKPKGRLVRDHQDLLALRSLCLQSRSHVGPLKCPVLEVKGKRFFGGGCGCECKHGELERLGQLALGAQMGEVVAQLLDVAFEESEEDGWICLADVEFEFDFLDEVGGICGHLLER